MAGELIILPVRAGVGAARLAIRMGTRITARVTGQALALANGVVTSLLPDPPQAEPSVTPTAPSPPEPVEVAPPEPPTTPKPAPPEPAPVVAIPPEPPAPPAPEPTHVSEEPELVEEVAEIGAEQGAGAEVTIAEPWDGYRHMRADDVIARLSIASTAELAAVQLYEEAHRHRQTVLAAVRRELRIKAGNTAQAADQVREE